MAEQTIASDTPRQQPGLPAGHGHHRSRAPGRCWPWSAGAGVKNSHYDIITQGTRQPGSGFKLFTLLAALQQGYSIYDTLDAQSPCAINFPTDHDLLNNPANNDEGNGGGVVTLLNATAKSLNCAYIRLAHEVGLPNVISMAHSWGSREDLPEYPSIVIGSIAVHPIEMAAAYAAVADNGVYHAPSFIDHIVDRSGTTIYIGASPGQPGGLEPRSPRRRPWPCRQSSSTAPAPAAALYNRPVAGKTGTTNNNVDAWFNGFTPQLETTVWMGNADAEVPMSTWAASVRSTGARFPAHTWHDFMSSALADAPVVPFAPPNYGPCCPRRTTSPRRPWCATTSSTTTRCTSLPSPTPASRTRRPSRRPHIPSPETPTPPRSTSPSTVPRRPATRTVAPTPAPRHGAGTATDPWPPLTQPR